MEIDDDKLIIVTGGAGFIGSGLVRYLNEKGYSKNIVLVDRLGHDDKWKNLVGKRFLEIVHADRLFSYLEGKEDEIGAFFHLGACSDTTESDADFLLENNFRYSVRLCEYALKNDIRFIYASSAATYGDGTLGFSDDHDMLHELQPLNMYGYSKHLFDMWLEEQDLLGKVTGLKYFNVYGPNEAHKGHMASAITRFVPDALQKGNIQLFKSCDPGNFPDGDQRRDFIYVKDAVRMTYQFLVNPAYGIFNIGTGQATTWNQLAKACIEVLPQSKASINYVDMPEKLKGKYQNYTCADVSKLEKVFGNSFVTCNSVEKNVLDYVSHYLIPGKKW